MTIHNKNEEEQEQITRRKINTKENKDEEEGE